jgi:hypothetical protein
MDTHRHYEIAMQIAEMIRTIPYEQQELVWAGIQAQHNLSDLELISIQNTVKIIHRTPANPPTTSYTDSFHPPPSYQQYPPPTSPPPTQDGWRASKFANLCEPDGVPRWRKVEKMWGGKQYFQNNHFVQRNSYRNTTPVDAQRDMIIRTAVQISLDYTLEEDQRTLLTRYADHATNCRYKCVNPIIITVMLVMIAAGILIWIMVKGALGIGVSLTVCIIPGGSALIGMIFCCICNAQWDKQTHAMEEDARRRRQGFEVETSSSGCQGAPMAMNF